MAIDDRRRHEARTLRVSAWKGDRHVVVLSPAPDRSPPGAGAIAAELRALAAGGVHRVLTAALRAPDLEPFLANGFTEADRLHLLRHDLTDLHALPAPGGHLRRARFRDRPAVLHLDGLAFDPFWALDAAGLRDALDATPSRRFRVAQDRDRTVTGYAVTGRAGGQGYLQRLAVHPDHEGHGLGRALVADALRWLRRRGAAHAFVNTQVVNERAYALYRACGFVPEPSGLTVLARDLAPEPQP